MSKEFSININDFKGIFRAMAEKANINGGKTLDEVEISIFDEIEATYNIKNNTFIFDKKFYNEKGNEVEPYNYLFEKNASTKVYKQEKVVNNVKSNLAVQRAKEFARQFEKNRNKTVVVKKNVNGKPVAFSYNRASIEEYIINNAVDAKGNKITYFEDIPAIRNKKFSQRTKEEINKLGEFNNMVKCAINAGVEYGVDPKLIISIMQREVGFNGLNKNVVGKNGKGYMQITTIPIKDMLGGYTKNKKIHYSEELKTDIYGKEIEELLKSRGFNVNCPASERGKLVEKIENYLMANTDTDFNIRLGTLILRRYLNKYNGDVELTAQNYNGNSKNNIKYKYGKAVKNYYNQLSTIENIQSV